MQLDTCTPDHVWDGEMNKRSWNYSLAPHGYQGSYCSHGPRNQPPIIQSKEKQKGKTRSLGAKVGQARKSHKSSLIGYCDYISSSPPSASSLARHCYSSVG